MGFSRQEYWSGLLFPPPGDLPDPRMDPMSPPLEADSLPSEPPGKLGSPQLWLNSLDIRFSRSIRCDWGLADHVGKTEWMIWEGFFLMTFSGYGCIEKLKWEFQFKGPHCYLKQSSVQWERPILETGHLQLLSVFCSVVIMCIRKVITAYLENIGLAECLIKSIFGMVGDFSHTNYIEKN